MITLIDFEKFFLGEGVTLAKDLFAIIALFLAIRVLISCLKRAVNKTKIERTLPNFLISVTSIGLTVAWAIFALSKFTNIDGSAIVTFGSAFSLGASLALQSTIQALASGVIIILTKPFVEGEYIVVGGDEGTVTSISLFYTTLKTPDGLLINVPNTTVLGSSIKNIGRLPTRRLAIDVPVGYGTDVKLLKDVLTNKVLAKHQEILEDPAPNVVLLSYGDSNLNFSLRAWVASDKYWDTLFALNEEILEELTLANIPIDYNQIDLHIKSMPKGDN